MAIPVHVERCQYSTKFSTVSRTLSLRMGKNVCACVYMDWVKVEWGTESQHERELRELYGSLKVVVNILESKLAPWRKWLCRVGGSVALFIGEGSSMLPSLSVTVHSICKETQFSIGLGSRVLLVWMSNSESQLRQQREVLESLCATLCSEKQLHESTRRFIFHNDP